MLSKLHVAVNELHKVFSYVKLRLPYVQDFASAHRQILKYIHESFHRMIDLEPVRKPFVG